MSIVPSFPLSVSGSRFRVKYHIQGDSGAALLRAKDICIEQTVEYPEDLVPAGGIRDHIFGQIEAFNPLSPDVYEVVISYADELTGGELTQFLNVMFGNISMKPGIRVVELELSEALQAQFKGPRFGVQGLRDYLGVEKRPLLFTAIKPMGLSADQLAGMAYDLASGGMDIIKDDHGLANQAFAPFKERVSRVMEAVTRANARTGSQAIYVPNISGPFESLMERVHFAYQAGAGGLMMIPGLNSLDFMRRVADDDAIALPVIMHPAYLGSYVLSPTFGVNHLVLHGQLARLSGADVSIMPNYIGRFSYSREECQGVTQGCSIQMGQIKPIFPGPGGGISPESFADMLNVYGRDVAFLISGNLHRYSDDLKMNVRVFREMIEKL